MCKRRKGKRAQQGEERAQIINIGLQRVEEKELHSIMGRRERTIKWERNEWKREGTCSSPLTQIPMTRFLVPRTQHLWLRPPHSRDTSSIFWLLYPWIRIGTYPIYRLWHHSKQSAHSVNEADFHIGNFHYSIFPQAADYCYPSISYISATGETQIQIPAK